MIPEDQILRMAADAQAAIPGLGRRAQKAMDLVPSVLYLGEQAGLDWWQVDGDKRVSLKAKVCSCHDPSAPDRDSKGRYIGPVCRHRLAVMFVKKQRAANAERLTSILGEIKAAGGQGRLYVYVGYTGKGVADEWGVRGYFVEGQSRVSLGETPETWLEVGPTQLVDALISTGLRVVDKKRGRGYDYIWYIVPAKPEDANQDIRIGVLGSMDADHVEHRKREEYLFNQFNAEVRANVRSTV